MMLATKHHFIYFFNMNSRLVLFILSDNTWVMFPNFSFSPRKLQINTVILHRLSNPEIMISRSVCAIKQWVNNNQKFCLVKYWTPEVFATKTKICSQWMWHYGCWSVSLSFPSIYYGKNKQLQNRIGGYSVLIMPNCLQMYKLF